MEKKGFWICIVWFSLLAALAACGGGGGDAGGGIGGTGIISAGRISGLGSVTVNEITFDTAGARILVDDLAAGETALRVGMVVRVEGTLNADGATGQATSVRFDGNVRGPIGAIDPATGSLTILGQPVLVDEQTLFHESVGALSALAAGEFAEASGQIDATGTIRATFIERKTSQDGLMVTGFVSGKTASAFGIHDLRIDFSAAQIEGFPAPEPVDGDFVEVRGSVLDPLSGALVALRIENRKVLPGEGESAEMEGFIGSVTAAGFRLNSPAGPQTVAVDGATRFLGGSAVDLLAGNKVEVEGSVTGGVLVADRIFFRDGIKIEGVAAEVDAAALRITFFGLPAIPVSIDLGTNLEDKRKFPAGAADGRAFVAGIRPNDSLKVRGRRLTDGKVVASRLEADDPPAAASIDLVTVQGPLTQTPIDLSSLTILGIQADMSGSVRFADDDDSPLDREDFFAALAGGTLVKISGRVTAENRIAVFEAELEK